ncbi:MAG: formylglycine-generating enzyme family protein, partial [Mycobacterium sp.]|nr:formylglycine-generating enzyme family protein [Mycobacterium sp.]
ASATAAGATQAHMDSVAAGVVQQEITEPATPGHSFRDCAECPEMVRVPAGKFTMGWNGGDPDEKPEHEVTIPKPFAIGKFEVTFDEYAACVDGGGCVRQRTPYDSEWGKGRRPVIDVSWQNAKDYVAWLSQKTGKQYRLLTEAEWEYAARSGTTTRYAFGDTITHDQANFSHGNLGRGKTVEVGSYPPNAWGLYDMHGNVWEWVEDCYESDYVKAPADGAAYIYRGCPAKVMRGGSWDYVADEIRSSVRFALKPIYQTDEIGFRVARSFD